MKVSIMNQKDWRLKDELVFNAKKTLHAFCVSISFLRVSILYILSPLFVLQCIVKDVRNSTIVAMGGNRKRIEPLTCDEWKKKPKKWAILEAAKMMGYME